MNTPKAQPFFTWADSKRSLADKIVEMFPKTYGAYHEIFLGTGSIFFKLRPALACISDGNAELVNTYRTVRDALPELLDELESYPDEEEFYHKLCAQSPLHLKSLQRAARFTGAPAF